MTELDAEAEQLHADPKLIYRYFLPKLRREVSRYADSANACRKKAFRLRGGAALSGALTTVFLGVLSIAPLCLQPLIKSGAILLSAATPLLIWWEAFYDYHGFWVKATEGYTRLRDLECDILKKKMLSETITVDDLSKFYGRYMKIQNDMDFTWLKRQSLSQVGPSSNSGGRP